MCVCVCERVCVCSQINCQHCANLRENMYTFDLCCVCVRVCVNEKKRENTRVMFLCMVVCVCVEIGRASCRERV